MRQDKKNRTRQKGESQRGVALVTVLLFLLLLVLLAAALLGTAVIEVRVSDNYQRQTEAFYIAEAGVEQAKQWLKTNMGDAELMSLLLQASQNNPPDQSTLVRADTTVVNTPLGTQTFPNATGTYTVVIRDNPDDADLTVDTDLQWIINSRGDGPNNSSKIIEVELAAPTVQPSAAINVVADDATLDLDAGSGGTGLRIPPSTMDGNGYDIAGNPGVASCPAVPPFAAPIGATKTTDEYLRELGDLRSGIVKRANDFCNADGTSKGGGCDPNPTLNIGTSASNCCTPGLWWVRGSAATPRFDDNDPASYDQLDLGAEELHATTADITPPVPEPIPPVSGGTSGAVDGETGNTTDPALTTVPPADLQDQLDLIYDAVAQTPPGDILSFSGGNHSGGPPAYGSPNDPKVVQFNGNVNIPKNATFTGYGVLLIDGNLEVKQDATFNWTGIVIIRGSSPMFRSRGHGQINGAFYFDADPNTNARLDVDHVNFDLTISYSCSAIALAVNALPLRTVSWIELHQ